MIAQIIGYHASQLEMIWPQQQSLHEFAHNAANITVSVLVADYFNVLQETLRAMVDSISEIVKFTSDTLENVNGLMAEINAAAVIDSDFIK